MGRAAYRMPSRAGSVRAVAGGWPGPGGLLRQTPGNGKGSAPPWGTRTLARRPPGSAGTRLGRSVDRGDRGHRVLETDDRRDLVHLRRRARRHRRLDGILATPELDRVEDDRVAQHADAIH